MRALLRSTGQPPQWALVGFAVAGCLAGLVVGLVVQRSPVVLLPALTAAAVAVSGSAGPPPIASALARVAAPLTVAMMVLAVVVSGRPWAAAPAMLCVALFTSLAANLGRIGAVLGTLATLTFVLALVVATETATRDLSSVGMVLAQIVLAAAAGAGIALAGSALRHRGEPPVAASGSAPVADPSILESLRRFDERARDGLRRGIPLALCVLWYEVTRDRDALWVLISVLAVLLPTGKTVWQAAAARVAATAIGVLVVLGLAEVLPVAVLVAAALAAMVLGLAYKPVNDVLAGAASAFAVVVLVGAPGANATALAPRRLLDTVIGAAIALAFTYLLWPRDLPDDVETSAGAEVTP